MSDDKFDAIVVGAGVAGTVAAYVMAKAGLMYWLLNAETARAAKYDRWRRSQYRKYYAGRPATSAPSSNVSLPAVYPLTEESAVTLDFHRAPLLRPYVI